MKFRIPMRDDRPRPFVRVNFHDTKAELDAMIAKLHPPHRCHPLEVAVTICEPVAGDPWTQGMVADIHFTHGEMDPGTVAHEAGHAARAFIKKTRGVGEDSEEREMQALGRIVKGIHRRKT